MGADPRELLPSRADPQERLRRKEIEKETAIGFKEPLVLALIGVTLFWNIENQVHKHEERKDRRAEQREDRQDRRDQEHEGRMDRRRLEHEGRRDQRMAEQESRQDRRAEAYQNREDRRAEETGQSSWRGRRRDDDEEANAYYYQVRGHRHTPRHHHHHSHRRNQLPDARATRSASLGGGWNGRVAESVYGGSDRGREEKPRYYYSPSPRGASGGTVLREAKPGLDYYYYYPDGERGDDARSQYYEVNDGHDGHVDDADDGHHSRHHYYDESYSRRDRSVPRRRSRRDSL